MNEQLSQLSCAISYAYNGSDQQHHLRQEATEYCESVRRDFNGWKICLDLFRTPGIDEHGKFFALTTIQGHLSGSVQVAPPEIRLEIRNGLIQWLMENIHIFETLPAYLISKLALVLSLCLKHDYPNIWPSAFSDLLQLALSNHIPATIDLMLRILVAVDQEIVSFHVDRLPDEVEKNMLIKDSMRTSGSVGDICNFINNVVLRYGEENYQLALLALTTFQPYIGWIELSYVTNEQFLNLLKTCIRTKPELVEASLGCLVEIVDKGMEDANKLELLYHLKIHEFLEHVSTDCDDDSAEAAADVVNSVLAHLLTSYETMESELVSQLSGVSSTENGLSNPQVNLYPASIASGMLRQHMEMLMFYLSHSAVDVSSTVVPAAIALLDTVKRQQRSGTQLSCFEGMTFNFENQVIRPFMAVDYVPRLLSVTFDQLQYNSNYDFDEEEDETEEEQHRRNIRRLYLKIVKICPEMSLQFMCSVLSSPSQSLASLPFPRAEAMLRLVYHYGEALGPKIQAQVEVEGQFAQVLSAIHDTDIASHSHWCVGTLYLETAERYWKNLRNDPRLVGCVLERMCAGLTHENATLRGRASFLLKSMIRHLGPVAMTPFTPRVLTGLEELIFSSQLPESDIAPFFELHSLLLGNGTLDESTQLSHLQGLMSPVVSSTQQLLQSPALLAEPATTGDRLTTKLNFLAMLTKGTTRPVQHLQGSYEQILTLSLEVLSSLPRHNGLRCKFMVVLHRMVLCLEPQTFLRYTPQVLPLLVNAWKECSIDDFEGHVDMLVPFINQLMIRFESDLFSLLDSWLLPILIHLNSTWNKLSQSEVSRQSLPHLIPSLQAQYFSLVHHVVQHSLSHVLCSQNSMPHLQEVLLTVVAGVAEHPDPVIKKRCLGIVRSLMKHWLKKSGEQTAVDTNQFTSYLIESVAPSIFRCIYSPGFNPKDANSSRLLTEAAKTLSEMYDNSGDTEMFMLKLTTGVLPGLNSSQEMIYRLKDAFQSESSSRPQQLEKALIEFLI